MTEADERPTVADPDTGEIRILNARCKTCILNPSATRLQLTPDRLRDFLAEASDGHVICHRTLPAIPPTGVKPAICRGHADRFGLSWPVKLALALGIGQLVEQPDHDDM